MVIIFSKYKTYNMIGEEQMTLVNELTSASQIQEWAHYNSYDINIVSQCAFPISFVVKQHGQQLVY